MYGVRCTMERQTANADDHDDYDLDLLICVLPFNLKSSIANLKSYIINPKFLVT
jgi:hypothetical protein